MSLPARFILLVGLIGYGLLLRHTVGRFPMSGDGDFALALPWSCFWITSVPPGGSFFFVALAIALNVAIAFIVVWLFDRMCRAPSDAVAMQMVESTGAVPDRRSNQFRLRHVFIYTAVCAGLFSLADRRYLATDHGPTPAWLTTSMWIVNTLCIGAVFTGLLFEVVSRWRRPDPGWQPGEWMLVVYGISYAFVAIGQWCAMQIWVRAPDGYPNEAILEPYSVLASAASGSMVLLALLAAARMGAWNGWRIFFLLLAGCLLLVAAMFATIWLLIRLEVVLPFARFEVLTGVHIAICLSVGWAAYRERPIWGRRNGFHWLGVGTFALSEIVTVGGNIVRLVVTPG